MFEESQPIHQRDSSITSVIDRQQKQPVTKKNNYGSIDKTGATAHSSSSCSNAGYSDTTGEIDPPHKSISTPPPDSNGAPSSSSTTTGSSPSSSDEDSSAAADMKSTLSFMQKFGFGLGHIYNDLCAAVWFSYTLLFMKNVLNIRAPEAGALVMLGQVMDAVATPIVGVLADRYGTKQKWHIAGTSMIFISFPMIFSLCPGCTILPQWWPPIYFSTFIVIFQFAWAVVQITHFAMIPELSRTTKDRADLTATRYSASVIANVIVYIVVWIVLKGRANLNGNIGPDDAYRFRDISLILTLVGLSMSVLFHFSLALSDYDHRRLQSLAAGSGRGNDSKFSRTTTTDTTDPAERSRSSAITGTENEPLLSERTVVGVGGDGNTGCHEEQSIFPQLPARRRYRNFLKSPQLYLNASLYVFARLFMTTSLLYMPQWLNERSAPQLPNGGIGDDYIDEPNVEYLATVPLISFISSFVSSILLKHTNQWLPHQIAYLLGSAISLGGCIWIALVKTNIAWELFAIAILFGSGSSITMISSLCITADMIGSHTYQGGFVYSVVTFADKLITGIAVLIIESINCPNNNCKQYYQNILAYACGLATVLGAFTLMTLRCTARARGRRI